MGAYGCVGAQEARGTQKQIKGGLIMISQALIWALWPGKFPRTSRFGEFGKMGANGFGGVRRGLHGCNQVYLHGGTGKQGETRQKLTIRVYFAGVVTGNKTSISCQRWSRGSERIQGGNNGGPTGVRCDTNGNTQGGAKKPNNGTKRNENEQPQIDVAS